MSTFKKDTSNKIRRAIIEATGPLANIYWLTWLVEFWIPFAGFETKDEEEQYASQFRRSIAQLSDEEGPTYWHNFRQVVGFLTAMTHNIGEYRSGTKARANLETFEREGEIAYGLFASFHDRTGTGKFVKITIRPKHKQEPSLLLEFDTVGEEDYVENSFGEGHPFADSNPLGDLAEKACQFVGQQPPVISLRIPINQPILATS
jgi:hypothetical protein